MSEWTPQVAQQQLKKDQAIAATGQVGKKVVGTSGRCTMALDQETYIHTIEQNGGVQKGGKTIFDDAEFVGDMAKRHPHLRVQGRSESTSRVTDTNAYRANHERIFGR